MVPRQIPTLLLPPLPESPGYAGNRGASSGTVRVMCLTSSGCTISLSAPCAVAGASILLQHMRATSSRCSASVGANSQNFLQSAWWRCARAAASTSARPEDACNKTAATSRSCSCRGAAIIASSFGEPRSCFAAASMCSNVTLPLEHRSPSAASTCSTSAIWAASRQISSARRMSPETDATLRPASSTPSPWNTSSLPKRSLRMVAISCIPYG
eukprot:scaffold17053_cov78-Phaeocystis_antarctica.AAC.8